MRDFNLIYRAEDKNNRNLDRAMMGRFRRLLNDVELREIDLLGRRYTWSSERAVPTLVQLDRTFCFDEWEDMFPHHLLQSTFVAVSDHYPLILSLRAASGRRGRFHFEPFSTNMDGFQDAVSTAWSSVTNIDHPIQRLAAKFRATICALQSWGQRIVGNVKIQLDQAKELLHRLEIAQESRLLSQEERWLHSQLKQC